MNCASVHGVRFTRLVGVVLLNLCPKTSSSRRPKLAAFRLAVSSARPRDHRHQLAHRVLFIHNSWRKAEEIMAAAAPQPADAALSNGKRATPFL